MLARVRELYRDTSSAGRARRHGVSQWSAFFERLDVEWQFGRDVGAAALAGLGVHFWLPAARQAAILEPAWTTEFFQAVRAIARLAPLPLHVEGTEAIDPWLIVLHPTSGTFYAHARLRIAAATVATGITTVELARCDACRAWWFFDPSGSWACRRCGHRDGRKHFEQILRSPVSGWPDSPPEIPWV